MSQTIRVINYGSSNLQEQTRLTADSSTGANSLQVQNSANYAIGDFIVAGTLGSEMSELLSITDISGNTLSLSATAKLDHKNYDPITKIYGNQAKIYRAANTNNLQPDDGTFASIATVDLDIDQQFTEYIDSSGDSSYWYKFTYYNSITSAETNLGDSRAARGGSYGDYCSIEDIRLEAGFKNSSYITDDMIDGKRTAAQDEINGALVGYYTVPFLVPVNDLIRDICTRLSAGLLLLEQYGATTTQSNFNGQNKIDGARADLQRLILKQRVLVDTAGNSMALAGSTGGASGWPNSTTDATTASGVIDVSTMSEGQDGGRAFRRRDILGYQGRQW